jgi:NAD(P)-dependent dehydrogenase (short-subunit alcohol dehydrogenase family)
VGARLAIEFVAFGAVATLAAGLELAIEIASGACICLDSWHFFRGSPDWQLLAEMPIERLTYVQLTDALVQISADAYHESTTRRTFCGQGELDIQRFVAALRTKGYSGGLGLEVLSGEYRDRDCLDYARELIRTTQPFWSGRTAPVISNSAERLVGGSGLGPESTARDVLQDIDLQGRRVVVTGAFGGIGVEIVRALSGRGASVIAAVRDPRRAREQLAETAGHVEIRTLDLSDLASQRRFVQDLRPDYGDLHAITANAGVMACPYGRTADGFETQFGINHLGHFALITALTPLLIAGEPGRVVMVSSAGHAYGDVDLDDPHFDRTSYDPQVAYGRSKTVNVLFAVELDRRLRPHGVRATAILACW